MIPPRLFVLSLFVSGLCHAAVDGLVTVHSSQLDQVHLRAEGLAGYRAVLIEPARVQFRNGSYIHAYNRIPTRSISREEAQRVAADTARSVERALAEAFKARGYEIVPAPGPGVMRLSPSVADLFVNAPDEPSPWLTRTFTREAGEGTLRLEARDATTGTLLARVAHHATARQLGRVELADPVTNRFWFDILFRRFAAHCVAAFAAGRN